MNTSAADYFFDYFRSELSALDNFSRLHYRKILICVYLDTLAKATFPLIEGNRVRFTSFLNQFSSWSYWNHVATFQLLYRLEDAGLTSGKLFEAVSSLTQRHPTHSVIRANTEPRIDALLVHTSSNDEEKLVHASTFLSLFYSLRNYLVHEGREPGGAYEFREDSEPMYMNLTRMDDSDNATDSRELLFPYLFMKNILSECIDMAHIHFTKISVDPRSSFSMSSAW